MEKTVHFQMHFKKVEVEEKNWVIKIEWFASTPEIDRYNDVVQPKAFKKGMDEFMKNPVVLLGHDQTKAIWKIVEYKIKTKGLWVKAEIINDLDWIFKNISEWITKGFSIWFIPKAWEFKEETDKVLRIITDLDLVEISVVNTPANAGSLFSLAKCVKSFFDNMKENEKDIKALEIKNGEMEGKENENPKENEKVEEEANADSIEWEEKEDKDVEVDDESIETENEKENGGEIEDEGTNNDEVIKEKEEAEETKNDWEKKQGKDVVEETKDNGEEVEDESDENSEPQKTEEDETPIEEKSFEVVNRELTEQNEKLFVLLEKATQRIGQLEEKLATTPAKKRKLIMVGWVEKAKKADPLVEAFRDAAK